MNEAALVRDAPASQADASFAEITAKRRGLLRRYLYQRPRVMDSVVAFSYALLVAPTVVDAISSGAWLAAALLFSVAGALFFRRSHPVALAAFVAVMEVAVTLLHPWGSNVSAGLWFSLYAVAVVHKRRFALVATAAATAPLALLYLLAAVLGVVGCRLAKLPPMLGYLLAGVMIGPHALALSQNSEGMRHLGEFGVVFLMFVIGLEFSLPKLRAMRKHVFGLGLLQVLLTIVIATSGALLIARFLPPHWRLGWQTALALAGALAMSSTAIVVKLMAERLELDSEHGRRVMGVLLFQDLAVVPLLVLIPALGSSPDELFMALGVAGLKTVVLLGLLLTGGQRVMRWWLTIVARRKSEELFVLNLLLVTLALAWLTELAGLSLALAPSSPAC